MYKRKKYQVQKFLNIKTAQLPNVKTELHVSATVQCHLQGVLMLKDIYSVILQLANCK